MQSLAISGLALAALAITQPALAASDSAVGAPPGTMQAPTMQAAPPIARPAYGMQLSREWMSPQYHISDYRAHGLDRPAPGFGWSRYQDDMVLTDQWGRVYDVASNYGPGNRGHHYGRRETDGIAGGVAGAAVGAVAGNVIAGAGSRLAGSLIGGGVGALAGLAIEAAISKDRKRDRRRGDYDHEGGRYERSYGAHWSGYPAQIYAQDCGCETVTTTTVTHHGGGTMVPRQVVTYENVYAPAPKYRARAAAPTKYRARDAAPAPKGRERVRLHTQTF